MTQMTLTIASSLEARGLSADGHLAVVKPGTCQVPQLSHGVVEDPKPYLTKVQDQSAGQRNERLHVAACPPECVSRVWQFDSLLLGVFCPQARTLKIFILSSQGGRRLVSTRTRMRPSSLLMASQEKAKVP